MQHHKATPRSCCLAVCEPRRYAYFKKLDYFSTECIYSPNAYRGFAREFLKELEAVRPSAILGMHVWLRTWQQPAPASPCLSIYQTLSTLPSTFMSRPRRACQFSVRPTPLATRMRSFASGSLSLVAYILQALASAVATSPAIDCAKHASCCSTWTVGRRGWHLDGSPRRCWMRRVATTPRVATASREL